jgi:hypothetical protein
MRNTHICERTGPSGLARMYSAQLTIVKWRLFHAAHEFSRSYPICVREPDYGSEGWTLHASFECAQYRSVYSELNEDIQLRKPRRFSNFAQDISEGSFRA